MSTLLSLNNEPETKWRKVLFLGLVAAFLGAVALMSSCVTEKQRAKICAACPTNTVTSITKKDSTSIKDSLAKVPEKDGGDVTFTFGNDSTNDKSECDSIKAELLRLKAKPVVKHYNGVTTTINSTGKSVTFDCKCDSFEIELKKLKIEHWALINSSKEDKIVTNECPETWKQTTYRYGFWILFPIVLILLGIGIFRGIAWLRKIMP